jgi:hypothetical protein
MATDRRRHRELEVRPLSTFASMGIRRRSKQRRDSDDFDPEIVFAKRPAQVEPEKLTFEDAVRWWREEQRRREGQEPRPPQIAPTIEWEEVGTGRRGSTPVRWDGCVPAVSQIQAASGAERHLDLPSPMVLQRLGGLSRQVDEPPDPDAPPILDLMRMFRVHRENEARRLLEGRPSAVATGAPARPTSPSTQSSVTDFADRELSVSGFFD